MATWQPSMSGALPFSGPNNQDDPLGLNAQQDAQQRRWDLISQGLTGYGNNPAFVSGPNYDPQWAAALGQGDQYKGWEDRAQQLPTTVTMPQVNMPAQKTAAWGSLSPGFSTPDQPSTPNTGQFVQGVPSSLLALNPDPNFWKQQSPAAIRGFMKTTGGQSKMPKVPTSGQTGYDPSSQTT